jgi:hypothetical protein
MCAKRPIARLGKPEVAHVKKILQFLVSRRYQTHYDALEERKLGFERCNLSFIIQFGVVLHNFSTYQMFRDDDPINHIQRRSCLRRDAKRPPFSGRPVVGYQFYFLGAAAGAAGLAAALAGAATPD